MPLEILDNYFLFQDLQTYNLMGKSVKVLLHVDLKPYLVPDDQIFRSLFQETE